MIHFPNRLYSYQTIHYMLHHDTIILIDTEFPKQYKNILLSERIVRTKNPCQKSTPV